MPIVFVHTHMLTVLLACDQSLCDLSWHMPTRQDQISLILSRGSPPPSCCIQPEHSADQPSHQQDPCQREPNTGSGGHIKALHCAFLVLWWYDQIRHLFFPRATLRLFPASELRWRGRGAGVWSECVREVKIDSSDQSKQRCHWRTPKTRETRAHFH